LSNDCEKLSQNGSKTSVPIARGKQKGLAIGVLIACVTGLAISLWVYSNPSLLPAASSKAGGSLLKHYLRISHELWLLALIATAGSLLVKISSAETKQEDHFTARVQRKPIIQFIKFIKNNPLVTALWIA
jgi:hypothetical protein